MDRKTFAILCHLLWTIVGLSLTKIVDVEEMVVMFLHVLAHDVKNHVIQREFVWSDETVSRHFNLVLLDVNCLRALDETYINVNVPAIDCLTFRTRKGEIATNILDVYDTKRGFLYTYWSIGKDPQQTRAFSKTCQRYYYLCHVGYPNVEGFLALYRGQRYHVQEWRGVGNVPTTVKEYFNLKYSSARNVIERAFDLLKGRWTILREKLYYPLQVQCRTILACYLLQNLINREMTIGEDINDVEEGDSAYMTTTAEDDI
ncbi:retrotransposon protein [Cucumis melo var. makuwa]|uniref:Retrotransposon protein n=1 Tax=Cucumis melo var. makuwa TaxID=1194695 RepID=A0A5D3C5H8_CUCMM|nr:retrotransposon protein [Cucumis melo var. makuwa]